MFQVKIKQKQKILKKIYETVKIDIKFNKIKNIKEYISNYTLSHKDYNFPVYIIKNDLAAMIIFNVEKIKEEI